MNHGHNLCIKVLKLHYPWGTLPDWGMAQVVFKWFTSLYTVMFTGKIIQNINWVLAE